MLPKTRGTCLSVSASRGACVLGSNELRAYALLGTVLISNGF